MPISTLKKLEQWEGYLSRYQDLDLKVLLQGIEAGKVPEAAGERELKRRGFSRWQAAIAVGLLSMDELMDAAESMLDDPTVLAQYGSDMIEATRQLVTEWHNHSTLTIK